MSPQKTIFSLAILAALTLAACAPAAGARPAESPQATEPPATVSPAAEIGEQAELITNLEAAGAQVEIGETLQESILSVAPQIIIVNGADVQVFEFEDEASREAASALISENGSEIGTSMVTWIDQPNFWAKGRLIVLYVGKEASMIDLLTRILGDPITRHE